MGAILDHLVDLDDENQHRVGLPTDSGAEGPQDTEGTDSGLAEAAPTVWVVIPAYNEARRLPATLAPLRERGVQIIVVDDGSRDDTGEVACRMGVWLLRHVINCGQGAALQTGIDFALAKGADIVVTFDADGQHDPEDLDHLIDPVRDGRADVVLGSRFLGQSVGMPWSRLATLKLGVLFTRLFSWIRITDVHNGLRAFSRTAAQQLRITQDRMAHASEILDQIPRLGLRYQEVPVTVRYSTETLAKGQSSWQAFHILGQLLVGRILR
jgi:glycosyltransferase involved in cell wall biosynthesis